MNDYYEQNMPDHVKPQQHTDTNTVTRFIKDKYVKKKWINEDEDDPVELYQSGKLEKKMRKKEKKERKPKREKDRSYRQCSTQGRQHPPTVQFCSQ